MNTRPHCSKSMPTGIGGHHMPRSATGGWRIGSGRSRLGARFYTHRKSCRISPGATIPEPLASAPEVPTDDRRAARVGRLGHLRIIGYPVYVGIAGALMAPALAGAARGGRSVGQKSPPVSLRAYYAGTARTSGSLRRSLARLTAIGPSSR
jgi:hypothetical protein